MDSNRRRALQPEPGSRLFTGPKIPQGNTRFYTIEPFHDSRNQLKEACRAYPDRQQGFAQNVWPACIRSPHTMAP